MDGVRLDCLLCVVDVDECFAEFVVEAREGTHHQHKHLNYKLNIPITASETRDLVTPMLVMSLEHLEPFVLVSLANAEEDDAYNV